MAILTLYPNKQRDEARQIWPDPDPLPPGFVQETREDPFELSGVEDIFTAELSLDEIALEALRPRDRQTAVWRWTPGFHAGSVEATLTYDCSGQHRFELVTDPDLHKLTRDQFGTMVQEILEDTFALFSLSSFRTGIARGAADAAPPIARLEYLRSRMDALVTVIHDINRQPRRILKRREVTRPYHRATRATGPEVLKSFRTGNIRRETTKTSRLPPRLKGCLPANITQGITHSALDIREHLEIKAALKYWASFLWRIGEVLVDSSQNTGSDDQETQEMRPLWARRIRRMHQQLQSLLQLPLFDDIPDVTGRPQLSSIYRNVPSYRKFFQLYRDFSLGLANIFGDFLQMPLARTFDLYELWCFLRLLRVSAERLGVEPGSISRLFTCTQAGGSITVEAEAVKIPLENGLTLSFQRRYREYWLEADGTGSFSRHMIPDIVFAEQHQNNSGSLIVLDAKYRIDSNLNAALASIHMYRDALVHADDREDISGVVSAAYLLTPHVPQLDGSGWKKTAMPGRLFHPEYRDTFRFGAATLKPGMSQNEVWQTLQTILDDARAA